MSPVFNLEKLADAARCVRRSVVEMTHRSASSHVGSSLSIVDILVYLYGAHFSRRSPHSVVGTDRERFLLSKGHGCAALYATLAEFGYIPKAQLETFAQNGSMLMAHVSADVPGVEFSTGSLGHALPVAVGMALAAKQAGAMHGIHVLLSDGELNEGSNWEACLAAAHLKLDNLVVIIDNNGLQGLGPTQEVMGTESLVQKFNAFGFRTVRVSGHEFTQLHEAYSDCHNGGPYCIIADTVKGKGVSFMEHQLVWHYRSPSADDLARALTELEG